MQKGSNETVSFVIIIAVIASSAVFLFLWIGAAVNEEPVTTVEIRIQAYAMNSTTMKVINIISVNSSYISKLTTSEGDCSFSETMILRPGVPEICTFSSSVSGSISVYADTIKPVIVAFP